MNLTKTVAFDELTFMQLAQSEITLTRHDDSEIIIRAIDDTKFDSLEINSLICLVEKYVSSTNSQFVILHFTNAHDSDEARHIVAEHICMRMKETPDTVSLFYFQGRNEKILTLKGATTGDLYYLDLTDNENTELIKPGDKETLH